MNKIKKSKELPADVWRLIILHLRRPLPPIERETSCESLHQQQLTDCMRVSKLLNRVTAPVLYTDCVVRNIELFVVGLSINSEGIIQPSPTSIPRSVFAPAPKVTPAKRTERMDKYECLEYVRRLYLYDCNDLGHTHNRTVYSPTEKEQDEEDAGSSSSETAPKGEQQQQQQQQQHQRTRLQIKPFLLPIDLLSLNPFSTSHSSHPRFSEIHLSLSPLVINFWRSLRPRTLCETAAHRTGRISMQLLSPALQSCTSIHNKHYALGFCEDDLDSPAVCHIPIRNWIPNDLHYKPTCDCGTIKDDTWRSHYKRSCHARYHDQYGKLLDLLKLEGWWVTCKLKNAGPLKGTKWNFYPPLPSPCLRFGEVCAERSSRRDGGRGREHELDHLPGTEIDAVDAVLDEDTEFGRSKKYWRDLSKYMLATMKRLWKVKDGQTVFHPLRRVGEENSILTCPCSAPSSI